MRRDRAAEQDAERDAVVARADAQHKQIMAGDDRGIYGAYPPAVPPAPEPRPPAGERGRAQLTGLDAFVHLAVDDDEIRAAMLAAL